ncbi:hypothetical protein WA577_007377 [Blastocystis sp. JDR]
MRNLPKLTSLTAVESRAFYNPHSITLEDMPSLTTVSLYKGVAFSKKTSVHTKSTSSFSPSLLDITPALQEYLQFIVSFRRYS